MRPISVCVGVWLLAAMAVAAPLPQTHAITGVRIVQAPGQVIQQGTVVVRDGLIEAVGTDVTAPADAQVWEGEGLTVYPGLIDAYVTTSWPGPEPTDDNGVGTGHDSDLIHPERAMADWRLDAQTARRLREAGFTAAVIAPEEAMLRGTSAFVTLGEEPSGENVVIPRVAHHATLRAGEGFGGAYPSSLMGAVALFRQTLYDARWYDEAKSAYEANPRQARPAYSPTLEILAPVVRGDERLFFDTEDMVGTLRVAELIEEFGLDVVAVGNGEEYKRLDAIVATGLPHVLPVAFPDAPEIAEEDDLSVDLHTLRHWDRAPDNPKLLLDAGLTVALTSHLLDEPKQLHGNLATAIERGLSADDALAALTTTPAAMLGVTERMGTVETGKTANLVLVEGDLFVENPKIRAVFVDGSHVEVKETKPPEVEPAGTWELIVDAGPQGKIPVTIVLTGDATNLDGSLIGMGGSLPLSSTTVSGSTVEFSFNGAAFGMPGMFVMTFTVDGDLAKDGTGQSPQGPFTFTGKRTEKPDTPETAR